MISIDAKKKELLGEFKNGGSDYSPQGRPIEVNTHDFEDKELGKVVPYGVYDIGANDGYVSLGIDHDTGQFAVNSVRLWLDRIGRARYLGMSRLMITADGGGSNGSRLRLWKWSLQQLADETGLIIQVCHYPPGTSKWNKIEHRMFCFITQNWRAMPLVSLYVAIALIANTTTKKGLSISCELDRNTYPKGIKVSDAEMASLNITRDAFHLKAQISRELDRLELVLPQLKAVEAERDALLKPVSEGCPAPAAMLAQLKGMGPEFTAILWSEGLFRSFSNRRQLAAYAGLAPTPWQSGSVAHEQGVSKAGNPRLRTTMIQLAWLWLRHQPTSALSVWFQERVQSNGGKMRKTTIVALARKLLVALWKYSTSGVVIEGAVMKTI